MLRQGIFNLFNAAMMIFEVRKFDHCNVPNYTQQILLLGNGVLQQDIPYHQRKQGKATHKM